MAGPVLALKYLLLFAFFGFLVFLLFYAIVNGRSLKKSIPAGLLFFVLIGYAIYVYDGINEKEDEALKKFLGDYKLEWLDRKKCDNCKVRLNGNSTYEIIVNEKNVGYGKWHIETATNIPGYYLKNRKWTKLCCLGT